MKPKIAITNYFQFTILNKFLTILYYYLDRKTVAGWLQQVGKEVQTDAERKARNEYGRYLRYIVQSGEPIPDDLKPAICTQDLSNAQFKPGVKSFSLSLKSVFPFSKRVITF